MSGHRQAVAAAADLAERRSLVGVDRPNAIARAVGIDPGGDPVDASRLADDPAELTRVLSERSVPGRVGPRQKQQVVEARMSRGSAGAWRVARCCWYRD